MRLRVLSREVGPLLEEVEPLWEEGRRSEASAR